LNLDRLVHWHTAKQWHGYVFAFAVTALALGVRHLFLQQLLTANVPFSLFYISAILSAWYGGMGPGMLATIGGAVAAICYTLKVPNFLHDPGAQVQVVLFLFTGILFSFLFETLHFDRKRIMYKRQLLEMEVAQRHKAQEALVDADKKKNDFLAALAHELRSPLGAISNAAHLIRLSEDEQARLASVNIIERQSQQMKNLINDLTEAARISENKVTLVKEPLQLSAIINNAIDGVKPLIDGRGHHLTLDLPAETLWVSADMTRLTQVFMNILANAAKYTEPKGAIRVRLTRERDNARVQISDNGIGIAPGILPKIFDLYVQAESTLTQSQGGLGIGLNLVKRLTEMHGGQVTAHSAGIQRGSAFEVVLPLISAPSAVKRGDAGTLLDKTPHHCILIVDDNEASAETLAMMLEAKGHEVRVAHEGNSALRVAASMQPDLILLDLGLPEMDGYDVCRQLRQNPALNGVKIVAQTGWSLPEQKKLSEEAGFDAHLVKPVDLTTLQELLNSFPGKNCPHKQNGAGASPA
jgi:signal transduction histidine kinase/ActR/RegA family two-component response regulator